MNCEKAQEQFSAHLEGTLSEGLELMLSRHLQTCRTCRSMYEQFTQVCDMLSELPEAPVPPNLGQYISARINNEALLATQRRSFPRFLGSRFALAFGATAVLALVSLVTYFASGPSQGLRAGLVGPKPTPLQVLAVGQPALDWYSDEQKSAIVLDSKAEGRVRVSQVDGFGGERLIDAYSVRKDQMLRHPLREFARAGSPVALMVSTNVPGGGDADTLFVLPFGPVSDAGELNGEAVSVLLSASAHYDLPIVVYGRPPEGKVWIDCTGQSLADALRSAKGLEGWRVVEKGDRVELHRLESSSHN